MQPLKRTGPPERPPNTLRQFLSTQTPLDLFYIICVESIMSSNQTHRIFPLLMTMSMMPSQRRVVNFYILSLNLLSCVCHPPFWRLLSSVDCGQSFLLFLSALLIWDQRETGRRAEGGAAAPSLLMLMPSLDPQLPD